MPRSIALDSRQYREKKIQLSGVQYYRSFIPQLTTKIFQSLIDNVVIHFSPDSITVSSEYLEKPLIYEEGKFISRTFLRAGIEKLVLKPGISRQKIENILTSAQESQIDKILVLVEDSDIEALAVQNPDAVPGLIPGKYKHYTDEIGYRRIVESQMIRAVPHSKNGSLEPRIYITSFSLSPEEVHSLLFMGMEPFRDRGLFVISFDLPPELDKTVQGRGIEMFTEESFPFSQINIRYQGPNYIKEAA